MTFLFKRRNGGLQVRSTFPNPTMTDAVIFLQDNYENKSELTKLLKQRKVEIYAKVRDKAWHPMGVLSEGLFNTTRRG
jgi:hypothetical protein